MHWARKYVGLKHVLGGRGPEGVDCWGLLVLVYREVFGIDLPLFPGITATGVLNISRVVEHSAQTEWTEMPKPCDGAAVAMSQKEVIHHVGIWIGGERGRILHCWPKTNVISDSLEGIRLKGFRRILFYRHKLWPTS